MISKEQMLNALADSDAYNAWKGMTKEYVAIRRLIENSGNEKEAQIKAGATVGAGSKVGTHAEETLVKPASRAAEGSTPSPGSAPPAPTDEERREMVEHLYRWKRVFTSLGNGWKDEDERNLQAIRSLILSPPKVRVSRREVGDITRKVQAAGYPAEALADWLRSLGITVKDSEKPEGRA